MCNSLLLALDRNLKLLSFLCSSLLHHYLKYGARSKECKFDIFCYIMNSSRARFEQCLRFCKANEDRAKVWYDHYYKLLNSNGNTYNQPYAESIMSDSVHSQSVFSRFSALDVKHTINELKMCKM